MADIRPVTFNTHSPKRWQQFSSYAFARQSTVIPLVLTEVRRAASAFPIAFVKQEGNCIPVALLGLEAQTNLFVAEDGHWLGSYVPAALRVHPFSLGTTADGGTVLCVDEDSGLVTKGGDGQTFFGDDGNPSEALSKVASFLSGLAQDRAPTLAACTGLEVAGVLEPWQSAVRAGDREWRLDSLMRVNEEKLSTLSPAAFVALRESGALALAYAQLQSVELLPTLGRLAVERAGSSPKSST